MRRRQLVELNATMLAKSPRSATVSPAIPVRLAMLWLMAFAASAAARPGDLHLCTRGEVDRLNRQLCGRVLDFTRNHGCDCRICSCALGEKRDLYVYLPPGYDGITAFPVMLWLHGFAQDERNFLDFVPVIDRGIREGNIPPLIIAAPDGSIRGTNALRNNGSFYMNSKAGNFADYIIDDVWQFVLRNFRVRPEREAHVLAGASMGGYGAFALGFKHRETFGALAGLLPPLDIRYADCHDRYFSNYDPNCVMERDHLRRHRIIGRFYYGLVVVRERRLTDPLLGRNPPDGLQSLAEVNPVEMLESLQIQPGEFAMFIGIAGRDEFNLDAQAAHFLDVARKRGIYPDVVFVPNGRHDTSTGRVMIPDFATWLCRTLGRFSDTPCCPIAGIPTRTILGQPRKLVFTPLGQFGEMDLLPLLPRAR